tara:strand:- start:474 stop:665 length:192 start_codon:yes stop_codon:yes gene_type:complete
MTEVIKTPDGYTFYLVNGEWVDNLNPELVDMVFTLEEMEQEQREWEAEKAETQATVNTFLWGE